MSGLDAQKRSKSEAEISNCAFTRKKGVRTRFYSSMVKAQNRPPARAPGGERGRRSSAYFEAEKKANFRVDEATVFADFNGRTIGECVLSAWHVFWDILEVLKRPQIGRIRKDIASEIGTSSIRQFINSPPSKREKRVRLYSSGVIF